MLNKTYAEQNPGLNKGDYVKLDILAVLHRQKTPMTISGLAKVLKKNYYVVEKSLKLLQKLQLVKIDVIAYGNGRKLTQVSLTTEGQTQKIVENLPTC